MAKMFQTSGFMFQGAGQFMFQEEPSGTTVHYGVTTGPGISTYQGVHHANAHGVGGRQKDTDGVEGIPYDAPR